MIRSSKHILKYQTTNKTNWLDKLFKDYKTDLQYVVDKIWSGEMSSKKFDSTFVEPNILVHSQYLQILHKQAVEIISSQRKKKKKTKPEIKNLTIPIDERLYNIKESKYFDKFIHLRLPYIKKHRAKFIRLPIKEHKQSLKFKNWTRNKTILLQKINGNYYVTFSYFKQDPELRTEGKIVGEDQGFKKLLIGSDGQIIGSDFVPIYNKIARKKQGSKAFKRSLKERDNKINESLNKLDLTGIKEIIIENLKGIKQNTNKKRQKALKRGRISRWQFRVFKKFNNKLQRWCYSKTVSKLGRLCPENGVLLSKTDPSYTSQMCSHCGFVHSENRKGEKFKCIKCGFEADADFNAAVNISHRGVYSPSTSETEA